VRCSCVALSWWHDDGARDRSCRYRPGRQRCPARFSNACWMGVLISGAMPAAWANKEHDENGPRRRHGANQKFAASPSASLYPTAPNGQGRPHRSSHWIFFVAAGCRELNSDRSACADHDFSFRRPPAQPDGPTMQRRDVILTNVRSAQEKDNTASMDSTAIRANSSAGTSRCRSRGEYIEREYFSLLPTLPELRSEALGAATGWWGSSCS